MINTLEAMTNLLQSSFLANREIQQLPIDKSAQYAFAIEVNHTEAIAAWNLMRSHLETTKRYPVITYGWGSNDFFARFYYNEEVVDRKLQSASPEEIIATVSMAEVETFLEKAKTDSPQYLDDLQKFNNLEDIMAFETSYLDWFEPAETLTLILLPTQNSWDTLAYIHWFGACYVGTSVAMGFLKKWHQQYLAELVCHYGTMLQLNVGKLPSNPEEAFQLAWEQEAIAPCTTMLPGVSLSDHARALLSVNRWFLHERP